MRLADDLVETAQNLVSGSAAGRPRHANLRRAVSTAYYAVFHALAHHCAERLVGTSPDRSDAAWTQAYRALDHGPTKETFKQLSNLGFPADLQYFGRNFQDLQEERNRADYDPIARFSRGEAAILVQRAREAIAYLDNAPRRDQTALAVLVTMKERRP